MSDQLRAGLGGRIAMNLRTLRVHPEKWARQIARQRVLAYRTALEDLDRIERELEELDRIERESAIVAASAGVR